MSVSLDLFGCVTDPRVARTRRYPLGDLLLLALCGLLSGADTFVGICQWAKMREDWLRDRLGVAAIPSHDTLGRVLCKLDSQEVAACLAKLNQSLWSEEKDAVFSDAPSDSFDSSPDDVPLIAFDGKRIKGAAGNLNLLSAWASRAQLTLALTEAGQGAEEQAAMRFALSLVNVSGCLVTADAMHTQVETAKAIVEREADYLLALKANQGAAFQQAQISFDLIRSGAEKAASHCVHVQKERGPREERHCWTLTDAGLIDPWGRWPNLKTIICVQRRCYKGTILLSEQVRYFLSSAAGSADKFLRASRAHWSIENSQHWRLDVFFREDDSRVRTGQAAINLACLRRLALGLIKREKTVKVGVQTKRQMAGWSTDYLEKLLATALPAQHRAIKA